MIVSRLIEHGGCFRDFGRVISRATTPRKQSEDAGRTSREGSRGLGSAGPDRRWLVVTLHETSIGSRPGRLRSADRRDQGFAIKARGSCTLEQRSGAQCDRVTPTIEIVSSGELGVARPRRLPGRFDWMISRSVNGVSAFFRAAWRWQGRDSRAFVRRSHRRGWRPPRSCSESYGILAGSRSGESAVGELLPHFPESRAGIRMPSVRAAEGARSSFRTKAPRRGSPPGGGVSVAPVAHDAETLRGLIDGNEIDLVTFTSSSTGREPSSSLLTMLRAEDHRLRSLRHRWPGGPPQRILSLARAPKIESGQRHMWESLHDRDRVESCETSTIAGVQV